MHLHGKCVCVCPCVTVCFFKHNWTLIHEFRWKIVECRAYRFSKDASGDSTYEAWDKTVKSETVELNLQHGWKRMRINRAWSQRTKQFIHGIFCVHPILIWNVCSNNCSSSFLFRIGSCIWLGKLGGSGRSKMRWARTNCTIFILNYMRQFSHATTLLKTCFWQWSIAKQM